MAPSLPWLPVPEKQRPGLHSPARSPQKPDYQFAECPASDVIPSSRPRDDTENLTRATLDTLLWMHCLGLDSFRPRALSRVF